MAERNMKNVEKIEQPPKALEIKRHLAVLGIVLLGLRVMFLIVSTVTMWNMDQQSTKTLRGY